MIYEKDLGRGILYRNMTRADIDEGTMVLSEAFHKGEPLTGSLGLNWSYKHWVEFTNVFVPRMAEEGNSILAIDLSTNKIVGGLLNEDFCNPVPSQSQKWGDPLTPLLDAVDELEDGLLSHFNIESFQNVKKGIFFHLWMLGVLPEYRQKKIGHYLYFYSLEHARKSNYDYAFAECTGAESTRMALKNDGYCIHELDYSNWSHGSNKPFQNIAQNGHDKFSLILHKLS